uniref:Stress-induced-phosphoprotein 1 n=1 Tax=Lygus hesperus TaxID=30085 RepID=A0A0A9ZDL8_LYGHE
MREWNTCIEWCTRAYNIHTKNRVLTISQIAKMYLRKANAHMKVKEFDQAIESYKRSILEENSRTTRDLLRKAEQNKRQYEEEQYLDPGKSEEAKLEGNKYFNEGNWTKAIEYYSESIKRDPKNYKVYSNRAACYTKIMQWDKGLEDCNKC